MISNHNRSRSTYYTHKQATPIIRLVMNIKYLPLILGISATSYLSAATLINDDFTSDIDGWSLNTASSATITHNNTNGTLDLEMTTTHRLAVFDFAETTLASTGDAINFSFDIAALEVADGAYGLRVYLGNGTKGYALGSSWGESINNTAWLYLGSNPSGTFSTGAPTYGNVGGASADPSGLNNNGAVHTITGSIAYVSDTSVEVTFKVGDHVADTIVLSDFTYNGGASSYEYLQTFTQFAVGSTVGGVDVAIDNVVVSTAIPEPSSYAILAGLLAAGLVVTRRRR